MNSRWFYWRLSAFIRGSNILCIPLALLASLAVSFSDFAVLLFSVDDNGRLVDVIAVRHRRDAYQ
jgi:hypothetical protein